MEMLVLGTPVRVYASCPRLAVFTGVTFSDHHVISNECFTTVLFSNAVEKIQAIILLLIIPYDLLHESSNTDRTACSVEHVD